MKLYLDFYANIQWDILFIFPETEEVQSIYQDLPLVQDVSSVSMSQNNPGESWLSYRISYGCERTEMVISCDPAFVDGEYTDRYISVVRAMYGRLSGRKCRRSGYTESWYQPCAAPSKRTTRIMSRRYALHIAITKPRNLSVLYY